MYDDILGNPEKDIILKWDYVKSAKGYYIYHRKVGETYSKMVDVGKVLFCVLKLEKNETYEISVTAYNNNGESRHGKVLILKL